MNKPPDVLSETPADVASLGKDANEDALGELRREILRLVTPILSGAGIRPGQTVCRIEPEAARLHVTFDLPAAVTPSVKQALAVRVLDAVRGAGHTYGPVQVSVRELPGRP